MSSRDWLRPRTKKKKKKKKKVEPTSLFPFFLPKTADTLSDRDKCAHLRNVLGLRWIGQDQANSLNICLQVSPVIEEQIDHRRKSIGLRTHDAIIPDGIWMTIIEHMTDTWKWDTSMAGRWTRVKSDWNVYHRTNTAQCLCSTSRTCQLLTSAVLLDDECDVDLELKVKVSSTVGLLTFDDAAVGFIPDESMLLSHKGVFVWITSEKVTSSPTITVRELWKSDESGCLSERKISTGELSGGIVSILINSSLKRIVFKCGENSVEYRFTEEFPVKLRLCVLSECAENTFQIMD